MKKSLRTDKLCECHSDFLGAHIASPPAQALQITFIDRFLFLLFYLRSMAGYFQTGICPSLFIGV